MFIPEALIHGMISIGSLIQNATLHQQLRTFVLMLIQLSNNMCTLLCVEHLPTIQRNV